MSFSKEEVEEFKAEAMEFLDMAEKSLLSLDQGAEFQTAFNSIFRGLHSLKGAAGILELSKLQAHTHELETLLMGLKGGKSMPKEYISFFLRGIDAARNLLNGEDVLFDLNLPLASNLHGKDSCANKKIPDSMLNEFVSECEETVERISNSL